MAEWTPPASDPVASSWTPPATDVAIKAPVRDLTPEELYPLVQEWHAKNPPPRDLKGIEAWSQSKPDYVKEYDLKTKPKESTDNLAAAMTAAGVSAPASAAFLATLGAAEAAPLPGGPLTKGLLALVPSMGAAALTKYAQGKALEKFAPSVLEAEKQAMEDQPVASTIGSMAVSGFRPGSFGGGIRRQVAERAFPAALGGGIQLGSELVSGDGTLQEGAGGRIAEAAATNAFLNKATQAGQAIMRFGGRVTGPSLVSKADAAVGAKTKEARDAAAVDLSMMKPGEPGAVGSPEMPFTIETPPELPGREGVDIADFGTEVDKKGNLLTGKPSKQKLASIAKKQMETGLGKEGADISEGPTDVGQEPVEIKPATKQKAGVIPDIQPKPLDVLGRDAGTEGVEPAPEVNYAGAEPKGTIGELIGQKVKYSGYEGTLARDPEGNIVLVRDVAPKGQNIVEIANTGKDLNTIAADVGIESKGRPAKRNLAARAPGMLSAAEPLLGALTGKAAAQLTGQDEETENEWMKRGFALGVGAVAGARGLVRFMAKPGLVDMGMTAFHGTPHKVDKFSTEKIGTGEGAQVYGHGLYFAENPKVAQEYKNNLSTIRTVAVDKSGREVAGDPTATLLLQTNGMVYPAAIREANQLADEWAKLGGSKGASMAQNYRASAEKLKMWKDSGIYLKDKDSGSIYQVDIKAKDDELLHWDKPLSEQPKEVQEKLRNLGFTPEDLRDSGLTGKEIYEIITDRSVVRDKGGMFRPSIAEIAKSAGQDPRVMASRRLDTAGIKGIKYADQGSRSPDIVPFDGGWTIVDPITDQYIGKFFTKQEAREAAAKRETHNYVIFNDKNIEITHENGQPVAKPSKMAGEKGASTPMLGLHLASGAAGAVAGSTQGDTPEERRRNMILGGLMGLAAPSLVKGAMGVSNRLKTQGKAVSEPSRAQTKQPNAIQEQSAAGIPLGASPRVGKEVGQGVRQPQEPSGARQAQEENPFERLVRGIAKGETPLQAAQDAPTPSLASPNEAQAWSPAISRSDFGKAIKKGLLAIEDNVLAISKPVGGAIREYQGLIDNLRVEWSTPVEKFFKEVRESLTPEEIDAFDRLVQGFGTNNHAEAEKILASKPNGEQLIQGFREAKKVYEDMAQAEENVGRKVNRIDDAWPRQMLNYDKFRKSLDMEEQSRLEGAMDAARKDKGRGLSEQEQSDIINNAISLTLRGKPTFLKQRTVKGLTAEQFKENYEPFDVAMANRIARVSTDVARRRFLGKEAPEDATLWDGKQGDFGAILSREVAAGKIKKEGQDEIVRNLKDLMHQESQAGSAMMRLGNGLQRAQNALLIGDFTSAVAQYSDIFNNVYAFRLKSVAKAVGQQLLGKAPIKFEDLGLGGDTFAETASMSRGEQNTKAKRLQGFIVRSMTGIHDRINKQITINAARNDFVDALKNPDSRTFREFDQKYSQMFPERWPEMLKDLKSDAFAKDGKLNDNTRFFLYNELARLQPLTMAQRAQAESSDPAFRFLYSLKRYWIKELNILRTEGYEKIVHGKGAEERLHGARNMALFLGLAALKGMSVAGVKNLIFDREDDASENAFQGMANIFGVSSYFVKQFSQDPVMAGIKTFVPASGIAGDVMADYKTLMSGSGADLKAAKYIPFVGRTYYNRFGGGAEANVKSSQLQQKQMLQSGISSPLISEIDRLMFPKPPKK